MSTDDPTTHEPRLTTRGLISEEPLPEDSRRKDPWLSASRLPRIAGITALLLIIVVACIFLGARLYLRHAASANLPQLDGSLSVPGLSGRVTVQRDFHGVPHIRAASLDDLVFAQAFITASDRLFQMDLIRRHAAGELAEVIGASAVKVDAYQRTLQIRAAADRAVAAMPPDQLHLLERYAAGVNASIAQQSAHLPVEFTILRYTPAPWTPRDSILVSLAMYQDLTTSFPTKLARESLLARFPPALAQQYEQDLFPVGGWRDHPPAAPIPDVTIEGPPIEDIPLDESQSRLAPASTPPGSPLLPESSSFTAGSNNWVISGAHTASGKPLLANDMHLSHTLPGIWYEADLEATTSGSAAPFHAAGVSLPGVPLIVVGHNAHIAWGFTNLGADVQDLYLENTRGPKGASQASEFQTTDGTWQPILHIPEVIKVKGGSSITLDVTATHHGSRITPILNPILTPDVTHLRTIALRWTIYDPSTLSLPIYALDTASDWTSFLAAFSHGGIPAQNVVYADDQGHIGYHATGSIPMRGANASGVAAAASVLALPADIAAPRAAPQATLQASPNPLHPPDFQAPAATAVAQLAGPISPVPQRSSAAIEWSGYIPFDQLPQVFDPPGGVIATANARVTPDDYPYPIALNWAESYRVERIWKSLAHRTGLTPADMLALQNDVYSDFDHVLAERLAYALDNALAKPAHPLSSSESRTLHQVADLLRSFNGRMTTDSTAPAIVAAAHAELWPMLLGPRVAGLKPGEDPALLYSWGEKDFALEQILLHTPARWLPKGYANWNDFLMDVVERGMVAVHAPSDLSTLRYGTIHQVDIEHPIFEQSPLLRRVFGLRTGTGPQPQSGDGTTVKQVNRAFGPSERLTVDMANLDHSTLNVVAGQSGNPESPWFLDQFPAWLSGHTFPMPFNERPTNHTLTLNPRQN